MLTNYQAAVLDTAHRHLQKHCPERAPHAAAFIQSLAETEAKPAGWIGFAAMIEFTEEDALVLAGKTRIRTTYIGRFEQAVSWAIVYLTDGPTPKMLRYGRLDENGRPLVCPACGSKRIDVSRVGKTYTVTCEDCNAEPA